MPSGGNAKITMDIQAKIVGYQESLNKLKIQIQKIMPQSKIGKQLNKQLKQAQSQQKSLNKNLNPKVSNNTQIDNYVDKINSLGELVQDITQKIQQLSSEDINFDSFTDEIKNLTEDLKNAKAQLQNGLNEGFKNTISSSTELSQAFKKLKIEINGKSRIQILDELTKKSKQAEENVNKLNQQYQKAKQKAASKQSALSNIQKNPLINKQAFQGQLKDLTSQYTNAIQLLRERVTNGVTSLLGPNNKKDSQKIVANFLGGLTPDNLRTKIIELKNTLKQQLGNEISAKEIYSAVFGDWGTGGNGSAVETKIFHELFKDIPIENIKQRFTSIIQQISGQLTSKQVGTITELISKNDIDAALQTTLQYLPSAYQKITGEMIKLKQQSLEAGKERDVAKGNLDVATKQQQNIDSIRAELTGKIEQLQNENEKLTQKVSELQKLIENNKEKITSGIKQTAKNVGDSAKVYQLSAQQAAKYRAELQRVQAKQQMLGKIQGVVQRWFSIYAAVRMVSNAVKQVISTVKQLDKTITEIAIVTDMGQDDLWGQMDTYADIATKYAASISGVYKVSQLYYQQGLQTSDVMALTEQTLKMARISGLEYATATDYMTNAIRSFKMEMTDAQVVVDTYSAVAASSATSVAELASAMSKTASSAQAVGSSFQNTTAMMAVMIEATRQAPENIGSALKSIISRYGEMKQNPTKLVDSEGEEMSLNKVDKALKSVGITLKSVEGQFRDFDDVIMELAASWDSIDVNTQRYIATVMAGNRLILLAVAWMAIIIQIKTM